MPFIDSRTIGQAVRFGCAAATSSVVSIGLPIVLHEGTGLAPEIAYAIALVSAFIMNFLLGRWWIFKSDPDASMVRQFIAYATSGIGFRVGEYLGFLLLHTLLGVYYIVAIVVVQGTALVGKFLVGRLIFAPARA